MEYRKFRLKNSNNEYYELADQEFKHFLYQPSGLGFKGTQSGYRFKNHYNRKSILYDLPVVRGTMIFHEDLIQDSYRLYNEFMQFLLKLPLEIEYLTPQHDDWSKARYAQCEIVQADKSETDEYGLLRVPIIINCHTFWRDRETKQYIAEPGFIGEQLQIPMTFPFWFGKDNLRSIEIENEGTMDAPLTIRINGTSVNPYIRLFTEDGEEYGSCKLDGTFSSVVIDSDVESITLVRNGSVLANPAKYEDLTVGDLNNEDYYLTFLSIKPGKSLMTASCGTNFTGKIIFSWKDEWISF